MSDDLVSRLRAVPKPTVYITRVGRVPVGPVVSEPIFAEAADYIEALEAENFTLAAGACPIDGGLICGVNGNAVCTMLERAEKAEAEVARLRALCRLWVPGFEPQQSGSLQYSEPTPRSPTND